MTARRYRKKPVEVEAVRFERPWKAVQEFCPGITMIRTSSRGVESGIIDTLEGAMRAESGDYIIKGVRGEFYPCKPDIFKQTYEEV